MSDPTATVQPGADDRFVRRLETASVRRRPDLLMTFLQEQIARRLHIDASEVDPRGQLIALGMSSLNAVELKNELERELELPLRSSLVFDYPTLETLVPFLLQRLRLPGEHEPSAPAANAPTSEAVDQRTLQSLLVASSDDVAVRLAAELADLGQGA